LATKLGVEIGDAETRFEASERINRVLLLRAWVYSVWRSVTGVDASRYCHTGLPDATAISIAQEMAAAGAFEQVDSLPTTDSRMGDVWFLMSKKAKAHPQCQFAVDRLPLERKQDGVLAPTVDQVVWTSVLDEPRRARGQSAGCLGVILCLLLAGGMAWAAS
jgi:hypothetical protein